MFRSVVVARAFVVVLVVGLAGGCMDEGQQSGESLGDVESRVVAETMKAVNAVGADGFTVAEAAGVAEYCGLQPSPGATYRTGARLADGGDPADQVSAVRDVLVGLGWSVESRSDSPAPHVSLTRDDLRASVDVSRRLDQPGVTFGITGPCLDVDDDFTLDDVPRTDLLQAGG